MIEKARNSLNYLLYSIIALTPFQPEADDTVWSSDAEVASVIISYVNANYLHIVQEQEQRYGITFSSIPAYTFDRHHASDATARYDPTAGSITFYTAGAYDADGLAKALTSYSVSRRQLRKELEGTIRHELGHDYFFERAEAFGMKEYWTDISFTGRDSASAAIAKRNIVEGVAEYMTGRKGKDRAYVYGYDVVEPILSQGCKEGIDAIAQHPLLPEELENVPAYTSRISQAVWNKNL